MRRVFLDQIVLDSIYQEAIFISVDGKAEIIE